MTNQDNSVLFEQYLQGKLNAKDRRSFEESLSESPELNKQFEDYRLTGIAIDLYHKEELKEELMAMSAARHREDGQKRRQLMRVAAAIGALLTIAVGWLSISNLVTGTRTVDHAAIFREHFEIPQITALLNDEQDDEWAGIQTALRNEDCDELLSKLQTATFRESNQEEQATLLINACKMKNEAPGAEVIKELQAIPENSIFYPQAQWYVALAYLKRVELDSAQAQLLQIAGDGSIPKSIRNSASEIVVLLQGK